MGINRAIPSPIAGVFGTRKDVAFYFHTVVTTTSGTIDTAASSQSSDSALTVVKTTATTGRYTCTTRTPHKRLLGVRVTVIGPDTATYGAATLGLPCFVRDNDINTDGTFELQFVAGDTNWADAEVKDAAQFMIEVIVEQG